MPLSVKRITLWRDEVENRPGVLAQTLAPLADARADLQVVMGYHYRGEGRAAIEVYPVSGKKSAKIASEAGLTASALPALLVQGNDRPGLGRTVAQTLADAGINIGFLVAQVVGKKFSAVIGFDDDAACRKAASLIKKSAR